MRHLFGGQRARKTAQWVVGYLAAAFVAIQVMDALAEPLGLTPFHQRAIVGLLVVGLIVVAIGSWYRNHPNRRRIRRVGLVAVSLAVVVVVFGAVRQRSTGDAADPPLPTVPGVAPGGEVIAVLPFRTSGEELEHLGEGLMDLLAPGLAQADVIATVPTRTVMKRLQEWGSGGQVDVGEAMALARRVGASSVLLGSAVSAGADVRLDAMLYDLRGEPMAHAQVTGTPDALLTLADELAVGLVRELWRSSAPIPNLDVSAVTTSSPPALRHYLDGERLYRRGRILDAREELEQAVQIDSTFALAHYRLAWAHAWSGGLMGERTMNPLRHALAHAERLPDRDRTLVEGFLMLNEGRFEDGRRILEPYLGRWPDDPEAWFILANQQYHHPEWMGLSADTVLAPFDRVIELDSTFVMAYVHPVQIAIHQNDRALADRYVTALRAVSGDSERVRGLERSIRVCFSERESDAPDPAVLERCSSLGR